MTTIAIQDDYFSSSTPWSPFASRGVSKESDELRSKNIEIQKFELIRSEETVSSRVQTAISKLIELYQNCDSADWDGRGSKPLKRAAINEAINVITALPVTYPLPDFIPESTGEVSLEWYVDPYRVLLLTLAGDGFLYYAGLYGFKNADHGSKPLAGYLNKKIISMLEDVYRETGSE